MSLTYSSCHEVTKIEVQEVSSHKEKGFRWQNIVITSADGSLYTMTVHLAEGYAGLAFMQREPTPERRVDDKRQMTLDFGVDTNQ